MSTCLFGNKSIVTNEENLSQKGRQKLVQVCAASSELKTLYELKEEFRHTFETIKDREQAAQALRTWMEKAQTTGLKSLNRFLTTLQNWWEQILKYLHDGVTQGFVEGMNNKVKMIKLRSFGFRNFDNFRLRVLAECGLPLQHT